MLCASGGPSSATNGKPAFFPSLPATVQCTSDGQFVVVVARDSTWPHIDVDSISLLEANDPSCAPADFNSAFAIFQFPVTVCGTTMKEVGGAFKMAALGLKANKIYNFIEFELYSYILVSAGGWLYCV